MSAQDNQKKSRFRVRGVSAPVIPTVPGRAARLDPVQLQQKIQQLRTDTTYHQQDIRRWNICGCILSLFRGMVWIAAILSLAILVIAFPLAVEPSMAQIWKSFSHKPFICLTSDIQVRNGRNCSWTSCRQGCTGEINKCMQVFVNVSRLSWNALPSISKWKLEEQTRNNNGTAGLKPTNWVNNWAADLNSAANMSSRVAEELQLNVVRLINEIRRLNESDNSPPTALWQAVGVRLSVNVKGCGYHPMVDCSSFYSLFGTSETPLPCYPNQDGNVTMAVARHQPEYDQMIILFLFTVPASIFSVCSFLLCCVHYSCCRRRLCCCFHPGRSSGGRYSAARKSNSIRFAEIDQLYEYQAESETHLYRYWAAPSEEINRDAHPVERLHNLQHQ